MRTLFRLLGVLVLLLSAPMAKAGHYGPGGVIGNDTGGIIPWSPLVHPTYRDIAAEHCARYAKVAVITSVHARYGDYIGFSCYFPRYYDPLKAYYYAPVRALY